MVLTCSRYENMSKEELNQELTDINSSFANDINEKFTSLLEKYIGKIHSTWFFNNVVNIKPTEPGRIHGIFHVTVFKNFLETDNLEEYITNASF